MKFLRNWLRVDRPSSAALHPTRTVVVEAPTAAVYDACVFAIEHTLGGHVYEQNAAGGRIDATFGLVNSERLTVTLADVEETKTRVTVESRRGALSEQRASSDYVDALVNYLMTSIAK